MKTIVNMYSDVPQGMSLINPYNKNTFLHWESAKWIYCVWM